MTWAHRLIEADWLDTGPADPIPWADAAELTPRLGRARALGYSHLVVYGDREHYANLLPPSARRSCSSATSAKATSASAGSTKAA